MSEQNNCYLHAEGFVELGYSGISWACEFVVLFGLGEDHPFCLGIQANVSCREELLAVIRENQVVVVVGETGSGKTTQVIFTLPYKDQMN